MKKSLILAFGTTLVMGMAIGAQAKSEGAIGDASCYQIGQPTANSENGDAGCYYQIGQATSSSEATATNETGAAEPDAQVTSALNTTPPETVTLNADWGIPQSTYYGAGDSAPAVYAGR
jgi:hypothetical protein